VVFPVTGALSNTRQVLLVYVVAMTHGRRISKNIVLSMASEREINFYSELVISLIRISDITISN